MATGLPWIRVYTDMADEDRSRRLGALLGNPNAYLHMLALKLWLGRKAPDGVVRGPDAELVVEDAAGWAGTRGHFMAAALKAGFLAPVPDSPGDFQDVSWPVEQEAHVAKIHRDRERARVKAEEERARREEEARAKRGGDENVARPVTTSPRERDDLAATSPRPPGEDVTRLARGSREPRALESRELRVEKGEEAKEEKGETAGGPGARPLLVLAPASPAVEGRRGGREVDEVVPPLVLELQSTWNAVAEKHGLQRWVATGKQRLRDAKAAVKAVPDMAKWRAFLEATIPEPFYLGQNDRQWKANVDWLLTEKLRDRVADFDPSLKPVAATRTLDVRKGNVGAENFKHEQVGEVEI